MFHVTRKLSIGIHGNNESDKAAKSALDFEISFYRPLTSYKFSMVDILGPRIRIDHSKLTHTYLLKVNNNLCEYFVIVL